MHGGERVAPAPICNVSARERLSHVVRVAARGSFAAVKRSLPQLEQAREGLGRPTIMDRALAARHGVPYVHLAVFAIDIDRIRDEVEHVEERAATGAERPPFAWEVFLTARYLAWRLDPSDELVRTMLEDAALAVLELPPSEEGVLGSQLPFAIWALVARGQWPSELEGAFRAWRKKPRALEKDLAALFARGDEAERELSRMALAVTLEPAVAPPTREALSAMAAALPRD